MLFSPRMLKAKHWQLFMLTFGIPMLMQFIFMGILIKGLISNGSNAAPSIMMPGLMIYSAVLILLVGGTFLLWFWSIGVGLAKKLPAHVKLNIGWFKFFLLFPLVYIFILSLTMPKMMGIGELGTTPGINPALFAIIIPLHLFSFVCMLFTLRHVAKTIKSVELQKLARFSDYAGEFFLIMFYPIGIWMVQPRINKLVSEVQSDFDELVLE